MTTVEVMFRKNFFLNDHGEVISYAVLVAEDYTKVWPAKIIFSMFITMLYLYSGIRFIQASDLFYIYITANTREVNASKMASCSTIQTLAPIPSIRLILSIQ